MIIPSPASPRWFCMATLTPTFAAAHHPDDVNYHRVPPVRREEALSLLLTGSPHGSRGVVEQFLSFVADQSMSLDHLWGAYRADDHSLLASTLLVHCAGRTAMTFVSPPRSEVSAEIVGALVQAACASQEPMRVRIVQGLLEASQIRESQSLASAGFQRLATLVYMQRTGLPALEPLRLDESIEIIHWQPHLRHLFCEAIEASYVETADCPGLLGLRDIEDILDGHMATGEFTPHLWMVLRCGDEPVGVMLLNPVLKRQAMELVYLGFAKNWRGKGLGRRLLLHGLGLTRNERIKQVILAVDEANAAAVNLYKSMKFTPTARKIAMIWPVLEKTSS